MINLRTLSDSQLLNLIEHEWHKISKIDLSIAKKEANNRFLEFVEKFKKEKFNVLEKGE